MGQHRGCVRLSLLTQSESSRSIPIADIESFVVRADSDAANHVRYRWDRADRMLTVAQAIMRQSVRVKDHGNLPRS